MSHDDERESRVGVYLVLLALLFAQGMQSARDGDWVLVGMFAVLAAWAVVGAFSLLLSGRER